MPTLTERMAVVETGMADLCTQLEHIRIGQLHAAEQVHREAEAEKALILRTAETARSELHAEAARVAKEIAKQNAALVALATSVLKMREEVSKWAAGGSLLGAVMLFIAVRVLGLG